MTVALNALEQAWRDDEVDRKFLHHACNFMERKASFHLQNIALSSGRKEDGETDRQGQRQRQREGWAISTVSEREVTSQ